MEEAAVTTAEDTRSKFPEFLLIIITIIITTIKPPSELRNLPYALAFTGHFHWRLSIIVSIKYNQILSDQDING